MTLDPFEDLARHYDPLMTHVDYDRWYVACCGLADLVPEPCLHLDAACGTGVLLAMLRRAGWQSVGVDISRSMLDTGQKQGRDTPVAVADLQALPFHEGVDFVTCLFDSMNFLLHEESIRYALREFCGALRDGGVLYFDIVTERMVTEHFEGQTWTEDNDSFASTWSTTYDRNTSIADTRIRINRGTNAGIRERVYPVGFFEEVVREAGLRLVATLDANTWRAPGKRTTRVDFVAMKNPEKRQVKLFKEVAETLRRCL